MSTKYIPPDRIEEIATEIRDDMLQSASLGEYGDDIYRIAFGLGCRVEIVDFEPPTISARVIRGSKLGVDYTIQVSRNDSEKRRKFSIAHEIAHIVLHDDGDNEFVELRKKSAIDYSPEDLYKEVQANMLASALLLPKNAVEEVWQSSHGIDEIAETFDVSTEAAYYRLQNLGLLGNE